VFVGRYNDAILPDPGEVSNYAFQPMDQIALSLHSEPAKYTAWFHIAFPKVYDWWKATA
jgi:isopentenyl-diphosphate Delta-isomerase